MGMGQFNIRKWNNRESRVIGRNLQFFPLSIPIPSMNDRSNWNMLHIEPRQHEQEKVRPGTDLRRSRGALLLLFGKENL